MEENLKSRGEKKFWSSYYKFHEFDLLSCRLKGQVTESLKIQREPWKLTNKIVTREVKGSDLCKVTEHSRIRLQESSAELQR
ncbi:hypothetical protein L484_018725 [Morus notabilis]|uniref:Uncharacterized protein n=1 Tax=Morus notabilis TaxID=981085 RepID=W9S5E9_9ROSA|nr:hypothetical protein L484_018725 [Morus notabilis]